MTWGVMQLMRSYEEVSEAEFGQRSERLVNHIIRHLSR